MKRKILHVWFAVFSMIAINGHSQDIAAYEFWFDDNFTEVTSVVVSPQNQFQLNTLIPTDELAIGAHTIHLRTKDTDGLYSVTSSQSFIKLPNQPESSVQLIESIQYWFDDSFDTATSMSVDTDEAIQFDELISASDLGQGMHRINIRFQDNTGMWSGILSHSFFKSSQVSDITDVLVETYQYWFDDAFDSAITLALAADEVVLLDELINVSNLPLGMHRINLRFKDNTGALSSVFTHSFYKAWDSPELIANEVTTWRYWLNDDFENAVYSTEENPAQIFEILDSLDFTQTPKGTYLLNYQFKDAVNAWSVVATDTIIKISLPIPQFQASDVNFCDSGEVLFNNTSIDADTYLWNFGDGNSSEEQFPIHVYNTPGNYSVSLTVTDLTTLIDSTVTVLDLINIYETPGSEISILGNDSICEGTSVVLMAEDNAGYEWTTGSINQSIEVTESGEYGLTIYNTDYPVCSAISESVTITVIPLPDASFSASSENLTATFTNTSSIGDLFEWNFGDGNTGEEFSPVHVYDDYGFYTVVLTSTNFCGTAEASMTVNIEFVHTEEVVLSQRIQLFPNPTSDNLWIDLADFDLKDLMIYLLDVNGKEMIRSGAGNNVQNLISLDISELASGNYILLIKLNDELIAREKVVVLK